MPKGVYDRESSSWKPESRRDYPPELVEKIRAMREAGQSIKEIQAKTPGVKVQLLLKRCGIPNRERAKRGMCEFSGCDRPHCAKGYCASHRRQQRKGKSLTAFVPGRRTPSRPARSHHERFYKLTPEAWQELLDSQRGRCAICGTDRPINRWHTDHDHRCCPGRTTCGQCVRAILCGVCNTKLGWVERHRDTIGPYLGWG